MLQVLIGFLKLTNACVQFELTQEVSVSDSAQVLTTYSGTHEAQLYSTCAPACLRDIRCNGFDICKDQQLCRTIRGWTPVTPGNVSAGMCQRFQRTCQSGEYLERSNGTGVSYDYCDFENDPEPSCFLSESPADDFDWTRHMGATGSIATGPTSAARGLYYKYIETSATMLGEKAILESVRTFQDKTYCLTMYYHMYGDTTNTLTVRTQKGNNAAIDRWQRAGDHGNAWYRLSGLSLALDPNTKIFIEATTGSSVTGDIAIDYIKLWPLACP
uniref:MAM and LDL-receptor class A domain-containing protein 1-like isoform X3 n=1 Tax=Crassostrea virginica TaxID=6565 RepID=A0A8B8B4B1_CRAVI|nr:MAM and LDL-receptor class A domain-containing protein 1-like isoform X3 [Crassostrea virginica]